jgi:M6 family metalloprotease-like protein
VSAVVPPIVLPPTQLQKDLSLDESITKEKDLTDLQVCKTSDVTNRGGSSNGFPRPATAFTGTLSARILIIPISFSDLRFSDEDYNRIKAATDKVTRFYETTSYRKVSVKYEFLPKQNWVNMTKSTVDYRLPENIPQRNNQQVVEDALALVDSSVNFNLYEGVAVLTGYSSTTRAGQGFPGMVFQTKNGTAKGVTLEVGSYSGNDTVMSHELGHSLFGLEDLYVFLNPTRPSVPDPNPAGPWDMMSNSTEEFFGWNKLLMGWLEPYHVRCITNQASSSHYIETIDTTSTKSKLILINLSEGVTLAIEGRVIPFKGVLAYKIDSRINHGDGPIRAEKALLGPKGQLTLDGWTIRVKDVDTKGFLIEVVKG